MFVDGLTDICSLVLPTFESMRTYEAHTELSGTGAGIDVFRRTRQVLKTMLNCDFLFLRSVLCSSS